MVNTFYTGFLRKLTLFLVEMTALSEPRQCSGARPWALQKFHTPDRRSETLNENEHWPEIGAASGATRCGGGPLYWRGVLRRDEAVSVTESWDVAEFRGTGSFDCTADIERRVYQRWPSTRVSCSRLSI
jgi:hypothetical protein